MHHMTKSIHEMYKCILRDVSISGCESAPRDLVTIEKINLLFQVRAPTFEPIRTCNLKRNKIMASYMAREHQLYMDGELRAEAWRDGASKFWWELRNPDNTINSNYGWLTNGLRDAPGHWDNKIGVGITQWEWARNSLETLDSRQAIMHFNRPCHQWKGNKDFPCTLTGHFRLRFGVLHYTVVMRSQDVVFGLPYDLPFFCWQLLQMSKELDVEVGTYTQLTHSMHMYLKDTKLVESMLPSERKS